MSKMRWTIGFAAIAFAAAAQAQPAVSDSSLAREVGAIGMTVSDMERSIAFYMDVLRFTKVSDTTVSGDALDRLTKLRGARVRLVRLALGEEAIELTQYIGTKPRPIAADSRSNDRWFQHIAIVVRDMDSAYAVLQAHGVRQVSPEPQLLPAWNPDAGGIAAFYFEDPDEHVLEVIHFPTGKGLAKWQLPTTQLFLGIDHTAIVVGDTQLSLAWYQGILGLRVAGRSENYGPEQERLNNVMGARLHITSLRAPNGPGIEFLEYVAPTGGRKYPADERPTDLVHWQTTIVVGDANAATAVLQLLNRSYIPESAVMPPTSTTFLAAYLARDPDGHMMRIVQRSSARSKP